MTDYFTAEQVYQSLKEENAALQKIYHEQQVELETLRAKLKTYEDLGGAADDMQLLRMGYAAARLEIESLKAQLAERASHGQAPADAKALAEADRRAGEAERILATCKENVMRFEQVRSRMKYQWGADQHVSFDEIWDEALALKKAAQAAPTTQPAPQQEPSHTAVQLAEMVLSDCGHSSNYTPLLDRVAASRFGSPELQAMIIARCVEKDQADSVQGDALDAAFEAVRLLLCGLERYSFVLDDDGVVRRVRDRVGNWIEFDAAHELFDPAAVGAAIAAKQGGAA